MMWIKRLFAAESGSILVMSAFALTAIMGMSGLAVEIGNGYTTKVRNQRVADMAALGAALAYRSSNSSANVATQVAKDIVVANGLPATAATVTVPVVIAGSNAVQVQVTTAVPIKIASVLTSAASYNVTNSAAASVGSAASAGCVTALSSTSTSIVLSGGASLTATGCSVTSNGTIALSGGTHLTAKQVVAAATTVSGGSAITTTPAAGNSVTKVGAASDSFQGGIALKNALCYVNKLTVTSDADYSDGNTNCTSQLILPTQAAPVTSTNGSSWTLGYNQWSNTEPEKYQQAPYQCKYNVPAGTYRIITLTIPGGCSISFAGPTDLTINDVSIGGGSTLTIGDGKLTIVNNINVTQGLTIGNGAHSFGSISVGGGGNLVVGSGSLNIYTAITVGGGGSAKFAIGANDAVIIGSDGTNAINLSGGSTLCFSSDCATSAATAGFSANGSIVSSGGSALTINKTAVHVINGDLNLNGSSTLGSGLYVIKGSFTNNTGGTMNGVDVTFVLGGSFTLSGGTSLDLAATTSATGYGIQDTLVITKTGSAVTLGGGTNDKYSGLVYAPKAQVNLSGGAALSNSGSQCLMMMVNSINLSGGASFSTNNCASLTTGSGGTVALIQ